MKRYRVVFDPHAQVEALQAAEYIAVDSVSNAVRWYEGLEKVITSLNTMPRRCAQAPESETFAQELRHYIYGVYRIIFRVEEDAQVVRILYVRHGARRRIGEAEDDASAAHAKADPS